MYRYVVLVWPNGASACCYLLFSKFPSEKVLESLSKSGIHLNLCNLLRKAK